VVGKLYLGNRRASDGGEPDAKADDALLAQRRVEHAVRPVLVAQVDRGAEDAAKGHVLAKQTSLPHVSGAPLSTPPLASPTLGLLSSAMSSAELRAWTTVSHARSVRPPGKNAVPSPATCSPCRPWSNGAA